MLNDVGIIVEVVIARKLGKNQDNRNSNGICINDKL